MSSGVRHTHTYTLTYPHDIYNMCVLENMLVARACVYVYASTYKERSSRKDDVTRCRRRTDIDNLVESIRTLDANTHTYICIQIHIYTNIYTHDQIILSWPFYATRTPVYVCNPGSCGWSLYSGRKASFSRKSISEIFRTNAFAYMYNVYIVRTYDFPK